MSYTNHYILSTVSQLQPDGKTVFAYDIKMGDIQDLTTSLMEYDQEQMMLKESWRKPKMRWHSQKPPQESPLKNCRRRRHLPRLSTASGKALTLDWTGLQTFQAKQPSLNLIISHIMAIFFQGKNTAT